MQGAELAAAPVRAQMFGKVLGEGTLTGRYTRTGASKGGQ